MLGQMRYAETSPQGMDSRPRQSKERADVGAKPKEYFQERRFGRRGGAQKAVWAKKQVTHHPQPHPGNIFLQDISISPKKYQTQLPLSFAKEKKPQLCRALSCAPSCQKPTFWDQGLAAWLAVSTAAKPPFQNRNHFLPRQQQNSLEPWSDLSCISEGRAELFKILMLRPYPKPK